MASGDTIQVREGRIYAQLEELMTYDLAQCSGLSDWNKPRGAITPIREQSVNEVGKEDVVGVQRGSADMAAFTIQSRLREIQNWLISIDCEGNYQALFKDCGDPGNYYGFKLGMGWVRASPGDLTGEPLAIIEGDNVPIGLSNPFSAIWGPYLIDFRIKFLSQRTMAETGTIQDLVFFDQECLEKCLFRARRGQYGYAVATAQAGSPTDDAHVWFTEDDADRWHLVSTQPFAAAEDISCVVKAGTVTDHRVVVSRGSTDAGNPAEVAYADVTVIGQTTWVHVDVGVTVGEYINYMSWPNFRNLFAVTNLGRVYRSRDGGASWAVIYNHTTPVVLRDVSATKRGILWICGDGDLMLYSDDYGETVGVVTGPNDGIGNLYTVNVSPDKKVITGGTRGWASASVDEGVNWANQAMQGITATLVRRIRNFETHWFWAIVDLADGSSRVLRSTDGGASWVLWSLSTNIDPNNGLRALAVIDVNRCVVAGAPYPHAAAGGTAFLTRTETNIDKIV
jgi:photosystem II stability/assembly factor-like uncharacterized protein